MATTALKKITREAKRIRKAHPGRSWKGAIKEASRKYKAGTISGPRKSHPKRKRHKAKAKPKKRNRTRTVVVVAGNKHKTHRRKKRPTYKVTHKVRRVRGTGGGIKTKDLLLVGGIGLAAYLLLRPKSTATSYQPVAGAPPLQLTTNPTRNNQAQQIIAWATAGGIALNAITELIKSLNTKSDAQVSAIYQSIDSGSGVPDWALA